MELHHISKEKIKFFFNELIEDFSKFSSGRKKYIILFICIIIPVFFSFSFETVTILFEGPGKSSLGAQTVGKGIFFNANPFLRYKYTTLPISQFLILFFAIQYSPYLIKRKRLYFFVILAVPSLILVLLYGSYLSYPLKTFIQAMNFLIVIEIFREIIPGNYTKEDIIKILYLSLFIVCGIKMIFDICLSWQIISTWFMFRSIQIYNYYDYFPIVYLILTFFSFSIIKKQKYSISKTSALIVFVLSIICLFSMKSRLYQVLVLLTPVFIFNLKISKKIDKRIYILILIFAICIPLFYFHFMYYWDGSFTEFDRGGRSLTLRSTLIKTFFSNLSWSDLFFPSISEGRRIFSSIGQNLHSEILEIYSCLGLPFLICFIGYLSILLKKIYFVDRYLGSLFLALLFFGGCFQLNFLQCYSGILSGALIGSFLKIYDNTQISAEYHRRI